MTITDYKRKTSNKFLCLVQRPQTNMRYHDPKDGNWKPIQPVRWEMWQVLADSFKEAMSLCKYHFYRSNNILVTASPVNNKEI